MCLRLARKIVISSRYLRFCLQATCVRSTFSMFSVSDVASIERAVIIIHLIVGSHWEVRKKKSYFMLLLQLVYFPSETGWEGFQSTQHSLWVALCLTQIWSRRVRAQLMQRNNFLFLGLQHWFPLSQSRSEGNNVSSARGFGLFLLQSATDLQYDLLFTMKKHIQQ